ncbi:MAG: TetR/AcrR family transcriptional regulator [Spirochaetales bacterium]|nr:TetR/AcrR family transcriptional regulator [Spirochaetales bacterium]
MKETKDKIILKALQYFVENDYQTVSLNSIAEGIGITKGGIYHYFSSKDELFMECMSTVFEKIRDFSIEAMSESAGLEEVLISLFSFGDIFRMIEESFDIDFLDNYFKYSYLMFTGVMKFPRVREIIANIYREMQQGLELMFASLQEKGVIRKEIDYKIIAFELISMVEGSLLISALLPETDLSEVGKDLVKSTLERICV